MQATPSVPNRFSRTSRRTRWILGIVVAAIVVILFTAHDVATFYTGYLWFGEVKLTSVWSKTLEIQVVLSAVFVVALFLLVWGNLLLADRLAPFALLTPPDDELVARWKSLALGRMRWIRLVVAAIFALVGGFGAHSQWNNWILFSNRVSFHQVDPLNHLDDSFYVFQLPFINWLLNWLFVAIIVSLLLVAVAHYLNGGIHPQAASQRVTAPVKVHLSVLLAVLSLVKGVSYYFERLSLVLSTNHIVDGATYTDVHANRPAILLLMAISVIAAGLFLYNIRQRGWLLPGIAVALWVLVWVLIGNVYPAAVQALSVNPSENVKEKPYINQNIQATLYAYGLGNVNTHQNYDGLALTNSSQVTGTSPQSQANEQSIANVRLLDPAYIGSTFSKFQELKGYYSLSNPEPDRYVLANGQETQTLASVRELSEAPGTQATSNWVNQHLQYTHGYGAVVAPASQAGVDTSSGYPNYTLGGIPPAGTPALNNQPRVYYGVGSETNGYVIADSAQQELDYENGSGTQVPYTYAGSGGVPVGGLLRRLAFAVSFSDKNILISGQIKSTSRIMYNRNVVQRLQKAAPFLSYDSDPYPVVVDGSLYWVVDAYTTSSNFPYSQVANTSRLPGGAQLGNISFNYVRNSVKAVVNAYTGKMTLFVQPTPSDPIIQAYEKAFPALFTPMSKANSVIPGITSHWRYPEDIFNVQTSMYSTYHQTDPDVFFQKAQAWGVAQDAQAGPVGTTTTTLAPVANQLSTAPGGQTTPMPPTYELMHLPGQTQQSFVLVEAFVNQALNNKQQNLAAFMTASSDPSDYGQLNVYATPAGTALPGPYLISGIISSNSAISQEITLLNQENSQVVLGNAVLLPIDQSLLYVQPLYVQSNTNKVPRLDDVIVVYDNTAFHSGNASLDGALCAVTNQSDGSHPFQSYCATTAAQTKTSTPSGTATTPTATSKSPSSSSSSSTTTTSLPTPPSGSTVQSLLQQAQHDFAAAQAALTQGNLAVYQQQTAAGETAVDQAAQLAGVTPTATTTTTTVAGKKSTTTTSVPKSSG